MSASDICHGHDCTSEPSFDLDWLVDDPTNPTELTLTPAPDGTMTEWISVDPDNAVAISDMR
jgi:hypothetical protein